MERHEGEERLTRIHAILGEGYALKAREAARAAKAEAVDPLLLGWFRFYEFTALYLMEAWQDAYDLFRGPEAFLFVITTKNAGRLGHEEDVVRWAGRCCEMRRAEIRWGAAQCLNTACLLLSRLGRPDLNTEFADRRIEPGLDVGAENAAIQGVRRLLS